MTDELDVLWQRLEEQKGSASATSRLGGFHRYDAIREMESLNHTAFEFYKQNLCDSAIPIWHKTRKLAAQMGDIEREAEYLYREGHSLERVNRLTEALSCMAELEGLQSNPAARWGGLIEQIYIANLIPISL